MNDEEWIIGVRKCVTGANPEITVERIMQIFAFDSAFIQHCKACRDSEKTPQQTFDSFVEFYGDQFVFGKR